MFATQVLVHSEVLLAPRLSAIYIARASKDQIGIRRICEGTHSLQIIHTLHPADPAHHAHTIMRPCDLVDVLEQLPPDVIGTMVLGQLEGDDVRSFKLVAPSTLALVRRASRVLHLGRRGAQDTFPDRTEIECQAKMIHKYEACMDVQLYVAKYASMAPDMVGIVGNTQQSSALPLKCVAA